MLKVIYDKEGKAISDFEAKKVVEETVKSYMNTIPMCKDKDGNFCRGNKIFKTSNELILTLFANAALAREIPYWEIELYYGKYKLEIDPFSGLLNTSEKVHSLNDEAMDEMDRLCMENAIIAYGEDVVSDLYGDIEDDEDVDGVWIEREDMKVQCSVCKSVFPGVKVVEDGEEKVVYAKTNFCSTCGTWMEEMDEYDEDENDGNDNNDGKCVIYHLNR